MLPHICFPFHCRCVIGSRPSCVSFFSFIEIGQKYSLSDSLEIARPLALNLEEQMLSVTHNINTHKGAIYLFAITNIALGHALAHHKSFDDFLHSFEIINKNDYETLLLLDSLKPMVKRFTSNMV